MLPAGSGCEKYDDIIQQLTSHKGSTPL